MVVVGQILAILTTSPGNLIIHLSLAFAIMATIQAVLAARRWMLPATVSRLMLGLIAILAGQIIIFASSGLAWQNLADPHSYLPPLDRAVAGWGLIWIAWLWGFPKNKRLADTLAYLFQLVVILIALYTLNNWVNQNQSLFFNGSWYDFGSTGLLILISVISMIVLAITRPDGWGIGFGIFLLHLAGCVMHLVFGDPSSDFPAWIRLAQLCSYPLLPSLAQRHTILTMASTPSPQTAASAERITAPTETEEKRRYSTDPRAVHAWLTLADQAETEKKRSALTHAIAQTMLADRCYLVPLPENGVLQLQNGYDLIRDEELPEEIIPMNTIPTLSGAIQRGRAQKFNMETQPDPELTALAEALSLEHSGSLLIVPVANQQDSWGSILLLSSYSDRSWSTGDQNFLITASENIFRIVSQPAASPSTSTNNDLNLLEKELNNLRSDFDRIQVENRLLIGRLEQLDQSDSNNPQVSSMLAVQKETDDLVQRLQDENQRLLERINSGEAPAVQPQAGVIAQFEQELRLSLEEIAHLQNALAGANMKILALEMQSREGWHSDPESTEVITSTIQELRQPITSVIGYTDLILSETVGILGSLQRKFMERIRAATERMHCLLDDLIAVTILEGRPVDVSVEMVEMTAVFDAAIAATSAQFREKEVTLRIDLPDDLPRLSGDQDSLEQIFIHLLQNAALATPNEGIVSLRAIIAETDDTPYLLTEVTDMGGGISPEDLPKVFWRHYRAENPLIQGVGDKGISLSIAKALVEVLGGRIWVDSQLGTSSTFSVLLPVNTAKASAMANLHESDPRP
jgi:signal transduction histidine kinase